MWFPDGELLYTDDGTSYIIGAKVDDLIQNQTKKTESKKKKKKVYTL